jgi:uncharacterized protein GlcG (DUF336 family)
MSSDVATKPTVIKRSTISLDLAQRMIVAGTAKAEEMGHAFVIAVVDESGVLKAYGRMDGAALLSVQVAKDKAYSAAGFSMPTHQWHDVIKDDAPLAAGAPIAIERLVIFGGGFPIEVDGEVVGGIGVSGGHYSQDMEIGEAALAIVGS